MDNLVQAHENAQKGKRHYREVQMVNANPKYYLEKLQSILINKTFANSEYEIFIKYGRKEREIYKLPYFPDRILHHAIMCEYHCRQENINNPVRRFKNV